MGQYAIITLVVRLFFPVSQIQDHLPRPWGSIPLVRARLAVALVAIVAVPPDWNSFDRLGLIV